MQWLSGSLGERVPEDIDEEIPDAEDDDISIPDDIIDKYIKRSSSVDSGKNPEDPNVWELNEEELPF